MQRQQADQQYYTLLGGAIEPGETAEQAARRELREEAGTTISPPRLVYIDQMGPPFGTQYIFVANYIEGDIQLAAGSIETKLNQRGGNAFRPCWVPISKLARLPLRPTALKPVLLRDLTHGFYGPPKVLTSPADV